MNKPLPTTLHVVLAGEQTAPNLLPIRHFKPAQVCILHTSLAKSKMMAERLSTRLSPAQVHFCPIDDFDVGHIVTQITAVLREAPNVMVNITGGTKPMSIAALEAARQTQSQAFYIRSQGAKTQLDFYAFNQVGQPFISSSEVLEGTIELDDYLVAYFGTDYQFTGFGTGPGEAFERALYDVLREGVDEVQVGWKHASGAVDVDFVIRCNNQIGVIEAKTGRKAATTDGVKQLAVAGGQRFFGTYVKRFLVIDQIWGRGTQNNRSLAEAIGIIPIELPSFFTAGAIAAAEKENLLAVIHKALGKPRRIS